MTDVFEIQISNHKKLSKKPAKKKEFKTLDGRLLLHFLKKYLCVYTVYNLKKHGFVTDITAM